MVNNPVDMGKVFKRKVCMSESGELSTNPEKMYRMCLNTIRTNHQRSEIKNYVTKYFSECANKSNAEVNMEGCISILSILSSLPRSQDNYKLFVESVSYFTNNVLPFCKNLQRVDQLLESYTMDIADGPFDIRTETWQLKLYDRILENHQKLTKRFSMNDLVPNKHITIDELSRSICEMVDTYNIKSHIKMELCFEEIAYLAEMNCISYNEQDMVESVTDYFLSLPDNTSESISIFYPKTIKESRILSNNADAKVKFLTEGIVERKADTVLEQLDLLMEEDTNDIQKLINKYKTEEEKTDSKFKQFLHKIFNQSPDQIIEETPDILKWVRNFAILAIAAQCAPAAVVGIVVNGFMQIDMRRKDINKVIKYFEREKDSVEERLMRTSSAATTKQLETYVEELEKAITKFEEYRDKLYTDDELYNKSDSDIELESYMTEELTPVVMNNLIDDAQAADKLINTIAKKTIEPKKAELTEISDELTTETFLHHLDSDSRINVLLCSYDTSHCNNINEILESVDSIIRGTNNMLYNKKGKVYYTVLENSIDFTFKSKFKVITSLQEDATFGKYMTRSELMRSAMVVEAAANMEKLVNLHPESIIENAIHKIGLLTTDQIYTFIEAWSYGALIDKSDVDQFVSECKKYMQETNDVYEAVKLSSYYESLVYHDPINLEVSTVMTEAMCDIINEAGNAASTHSNNASNMIDSAKKKVDKVKKGIASKAKSIDFDELKDKMVDAKKFIQKLPAKEREVSRDLDSAFNNVVRGLQNWYKLTDNKDQVLNTQVLPSFSKMLKMGVALAGVGVMTQTVVTPVLIACVGIFLSSKTDDQQRQKAIDAIDVELQIVDRSIKNAEDRGKSDKKYRALLTYQKSLERQKQNIIYHMAKNKKKFVPSSRGIGRREY